MRRIALTGSVFLCVIVWISRARGINGEIPSSPNVELSESCLVWRTCAGLDIQYAMFNNALTWNSAEQACDRLGDDVHLATPRNSQDNTCAFEQIGGDDEVWIGLKSMSVRQKKSETKITPPARYIDDNQVMKNNSWTPGQPDNSGPEEILDNQLCVAAWTDKQNHSGWDDDSCDSGKYPALCERQGNNSIHGWTNCSNENVLYWNVNGTFNWKDAKATCQNLGNGSHLATPRSSQQSQCVHALRGRRTIWLGMAKFHPFKYVDNNSSLEYVNWMKGQPQHIFDERCVAAMKAGWRSRNCTADIRAYICQRNSSCTGALRKLNNSLPVQVLNVCGNARTMKMSYKCRYGYSYDVHNARDTVRIIPYIDECSIGKHTCSPVENGGSCTNTAGGYNCSCRHGYIMSANHSCLDFDECDKGVHTCTPSDKGGQCTNINGSYTCSCRQNYTGNGFLNTANATSCARLCSHLHHSQIQPTYELPPKNSGAFVNFTCKNSSSYVMLGAGRLKCLNTAQWEEELPQCRRKCVHPNKPNNSLMDGSNFTYGAMVTFRCSRRHNLLGSQNITCGKDGSWSPRPPTCQPLPPDHTSMSSSSELIIPLVVTIAIVAVLLSILVFFIIVRKWKTRNEQRSKISRSANPETTLLHLATRADPPAQQPGMATHAAPQRDSLYATAGPPGAFVQEETSTNDFTYSVPDRDRGKKSNEAVLEAVYDSAHASAQLFLPVACHPPPTTEEDTYQTLAKSSFPYLARINVLVGKVQLSTGVYSDMFKGSFRKDDGLVSDAAVKVLRPRSSSENRSKFLQEATILGRYQHANIVKLFGVVGDNDDNQALLVLELIKTDLKSYLSNLTGKPGNMGTMLSMAKDVASGMMFLESKCVVHRNLSAKSVLISNDNSCKIASFGMARELARKGYYLEDDKGIPIEWMAPEAVHQHRYTSASDVWSYGITLHEIYSHGDIPYKNWSDKKVIEEVGKGYHLPKPDICPCDIYDIMLNCWNIKADVRPSFAVIVGVLDAL